MKSAQYTPMLRNGHGPKVTLPVSSYACDPAGIWIGEQRIMLVHTTD